MRNLKLIRWHHFPTVTQLVRKGARAGTPKVYAPNHHTLWPQQGKSIHILYAGKSHPFPLEVCVCGGGIKKPRSPL